jgi:hypothetical protein
MSENPYQSPLDASGQRPRRRRGFPWLPLMIVTSSGAILAVFGPIVAAITLVLLIVLAWLGSISG